MSNILDNLHVIILCAGKGTRLGDITNKIPKPLVKIKELDNRPIIYSVLSSLANSSFQHLWIVKGYIAHKIQAYISSLKEHHHFPNLTINTIDSKNDFKLGPLHSFLSIRKNKQLYKENHIYLVIPGDTIFPSSFLEQISLFINIYVEIVMKYPVIFYRKIKIRELTQMYQESQENPLKALSTLRSIPSQPHFLEKIHTISPSQLDPDEVIKQLYPCFLLTYSTLQRMLNPQMELKNVASIAQLINIYSSEGGKVYIRPFEESYNFYDLDYKTDLNRIKYEK